MSWPNGGGAEGFTERTTLLLDGFLSRLHSTGAEIGLLKQTQKKTEDLT